MNASEYLHKHWIPRGVQNNLSRPKHQLRLATCVALSKGPVVMDVGCATGESTRIMSDLRPDWQWSGCDFDAEVIRLAHERGLGIAFSSYEKVTDLPFKYNTLICSEVIEHVEKPERFVYGLYDKAIDRVVLTTPNVWVEDPGHLRLYTEKTLDSLTCFAEHRRGWSLGPFFYIVLSKTPLTEDAKTESINGNHLWVGNSGRS